MGLVRSVATKLTRPRRAPRKAVPIQEAAREVTETTECVLRSYMRAFHPDFRSTIASVVPTTNPATVPQPPAPPRKRGGKAVKKDDNEVQIAVDDA